jgi:hypothetical protein
MLWQAQGGSILPQAGRAVPARRQGRLPIPDEEIPICGSLIITLELTAFGFCFQAVQVFEWF